MNDSTCTQRRGKLVCVREKHAGNGHVYVSSSSINMLDAEDLDSVRSN